MRLHGAGIFGISAANQKGAERHKCPDCGEWWVKGSHNNHNPDGECPNKCPKCKGVNFPPGVWVCPDCGYDPLAESSVESEESKKVKTQ